VAVLLRLPPLLGHFLYIVAALWQSKTAKPGLERALVKSIQVHT